MRNAKQQCILLAIKYRKKWVIPGNVISVWINRLTKVAFFAVVNQAWWKKLSLKTRTSRNSGCTWVAICGRMKWTSKTINSEDFAKFKASWAKANAWFVLKALDLPFNAKNVTTKLMQSAQKEQTTDFLWTGGFLLVFSMSVPPTKKAKRTKNSFVLRKSTLLK